jgi:hypothetical protein
MLSGFIMKTWSNTSPHSAYIQTAFQLLACVQLTGLSCLTEGLGIFRQLRHASAATSMSTLPSVNKRNMLRSGERRCQVVCAFIPNQLFGNWTFSGSSPKISTFRSALSCWGMKLERPSRSGSVSHSRNRPLRPIWSWVIQNLDI